MPKRIIVLTLFLFAITGFAGCKDSSNSSGTSLKTVAELLTNNETGEGVANRVLLIDSRSSREYIEGHIKDALNVPYDMIAEGGEPLYTNNFDEVSTTASDQIADAWLTHMLVNQLVNDFTSTYQDNRIIFYGDNARNAAKVARKIGFTDVSVLKASYAKWAAAYPTMTQENAPGVTDLDTTERTFKFTGFINTANYENVSRKATHHAIVYKGGALSFYSLLQADIPPFCFQSILTYLGASPDGNMADGIYYGTAEEYGSKHTSGQRVDFAVTWDGAGRYYSIEDLFEEGPSEYIPDASTFQAQGIEPRIGGTEDSNLLWNPGCILCLYSCVCGITSNARANDDIWFADGGIYDPFGQPDDPRNYYAGRYFPKSSLLPGSGQQILVKVTVVDNDVPVTNESNLFSSVQNGGTAEDAQNRILVVDTRSSEKYIRGHIQDALNVPYHMIQEDGLPLYTNNWDEVSPTASDQIADSWLTHMLVNQLVNDFVSTYQNTPVVFYGDDSYTVAKVAQKIGYSDVSVLDTVYQKWAADNAHLTEMYAPGVISVDEEDGSFVFSGFINNVNYDNISTRPTHHGITYKGGALSFYSYLMADIPPFCFHEMLVYLGVSPEGNMADGIYYGTAEEYGSKFPDGDRIDYSVTWDGAGRYYDLPDLFDEAPSEFHPDPDNFTPVGIEARMGGTRDSNLLWNPGCIFCMYACVCGISSNDRANDDVWFADGGIYDPFNQPDDPRNYYAGRYFPKSDLMPGEGQAIKIKVKITE